MFLLVFQKKAFVRKYILNFDIAKSTGLDDIGTMILNISYEIISQVLHSLSIKVWN